MNAALKNFNQVRQDPDYGVRALYHMIDICLNPDGEMLAEQLMDSDDIEYRDSRVLALRTGECKHFLAFFFCNFNNLQPNDSLRS